MPIALLLIPLVAFFALPSDPAASQPRILAVAEEIDRISERSLWPGFEPRTIPFEVLDGGRTWLVRHPHPPAEFAPVAGRKNLRVFEGQHASLRANTSVEIAGVATATADFEGNASEPRRLAALVLHEMFHVFQAFRHPRWGGNEVDLFVYPSDDAEALALRRLESDALRGALAARGRAATEALAARALETRRERFRRLPEPAVAYERGTEAKEGLARYIEALAAGSGDLLPPPDEFPAQAARERAYASGCAIAPLLDRLDPDWKERLSASEVLHTRWLKLGSSSGSIEVLGRRCLTEAARKHPLFEGGRRMTVTGLPVEPRAEATAQAVRVTAEGVELEFRGARLRRSGQTLIVTATAGRPATGSR